MLLKTGRSLMSMLTVYWSVVGEWLDAYWLYTWRGGQCETDPPEDGTRRGRSLVSVLIAYWSVVGVQLDADWLFTRRGGQCQTDSPGGSTGRGAESDVYADCLLVGCR